MANKLNGVSILTVGEARGHNLKIDQTSLEQALAVAQAMKRIKVTMGHGAPVTGILGYLDNFVIKGERLTGDLSLFNTNEAQFIEQLAQVLPEGFGMSLTFSGVPEIMGTERFARVTEIYDCSIVTEPAANPAGMFSAFCAVDIKNMQMNEAPTEVKKELSAPTVEAAPSPAPEIETAPAPIALAEMPEEKKEEQKMAEPTLTDIAGMLSKLIGMLMPKIEKEDEDEEEMKDKDYQMGAEAAEKAVTTLEKAKADAAGAVAVPAETSQPLGRAEILNQFNAEKSPSRRTEMLRKLGL